ncbi:hypothetical protein [Nonomuraea insulae]|uniref:Uncharacterized protein n=1 Tax=Nonomuraea insulae TaxID=1616787 RepID=A0ABW1CEP0_9ACTN
MDLLLVACQALIGAVFTVAALTKLRSSADLRPFDADGITGLFTDRAGRA